MRYLKLPLSLFLLLTLCTLNNAAQGQKRIAMPGAGSACFIENKGQLHDQKGALNPSVKFLLSSPRGLNIQLRANGFSYDTYLAADTAKKVHLSHFATNRPDANRNKPVKLNFHRVDIEFIGANASPQLVAEEKASFVYNYASGSLSGPQTITAGGYQKITYKNIYPSIDLVFTSHGTPEYSFIVHHGGNPSTIRWRYHGATKTGMYGNSISLSIRKGEISERIPESFQGTLSTKHLISVGYKTIGPDTYGYRVDTFDPSKDLVIDPTPDLLWGTYFGSYGTEWAYCVARDSLGNVVFGGTTADVYGVATAGAYQTVLDGYEDAMIGKFEASGNLIWATYFGGESDDNLWGVAIDHQNNVYALGNTFSKTGIATPGSYKPTFTAFNGCTNGYIAKFNPAGALVWATYYGGEMDDEPYAITVDQNNDLVFCGGTSSQTGIATPGAWQPTFADGPTGSQDLVEDVFLAKFTASGGVVWSTYYGGVGWDRGYGVAIDPDNNILLTGNTYSTGMSTPGTFQPVMDAPGTESSYAAKFSAAGSRTWSTYFGKGGIAQGGGYGAGVATDAAGSVYVAGFTACTNNIATPGSMQPVIGAANAYGDGFLVKFDKNGARELWGTYIGGESTDYANGVCTDGSGGVFITGILGSATNAVTPGSYDPTYTGFGDIFVVKFDTAGARQWGTYYGISPPNYYGGEGEAVVADGLGDVYVVGQVSAPEGIASCGAYQTAPGVGVAFVAKFGPDRPASISISTPQTNNICPGTPVLVTAQTLNAPAPAYQWLLDGQPLTGDTSTIAISTLTNGDSVKCILVLNPTCTTGSDTSNSLVFHIDPELSPSLSITTASDSVCPGVPVTFTAVGVNPGPQPSYQWSVNGVAAGTDSSGFTTKSLQTGDIVSCLLTHQGSCIADSTAPSNPIAIGVRQAPSMSVSINSGQNPICSGTAVQFTAMANAASAFLYSWEVNGITVGSDSPTFSSSVLEDGDQIVCQIQPASGICVFQPVPSDTVTETVYPTPNINITGDSILTRGETSQLNATVTVSPVTYQWTPDTSLSSGTISNPVASPWLTTTYRLVVTSAQGCAAQKSFTIQVVPKISIPNAFTPNGDGKNDVFRAIYGPDISNVRLSVFDRWGELLFTDPGTHQGWDGSVNGKKQPPGTFVWLFEYKDQTGISRVLKGTVELIR